MDGGYRRSRASSIGIYSKILEPFLPGALSFMGVNFGGQI
jgi:hypothetical protein